MAEYTVGKYTRGTISKAETMMRGVIDYTNPRLFNLYESGYSFLTVLQRPEYLEKLAGQSSNIKNLLDLFCWILEYEFRGLSGIEDVTAETLEFTDGINTINTIGKVNKASASEISMTFTERSGLALTKLVDFYLTGIRDPRTQAKTYHGLIKRGLLKAGFENEVFMLMYIVTDNTLLVAEKCFLLANAWPTKAEFSILDSEKGSIEKKEISMPWQCFVVDGEEVDELGAMILGALNETVDEAQYTSASANYYRAMGNQKAAEAAEEGSTNGTNRARLDSTNYVDGSNMYQAVKLGKAMYDNKNNNTSAEWASGTIKNG